MEVLKYLDIKQYDTCSPSYLRGWGSKTAEAQELEAIPGKHSETLSENKQQKPFEAYACYTQCTSLGVAQTTWFLKVFFQCR